MIPRQVGYRGYENRKVSKIPSPIRKCGYGGGKIGVIPMQVGYRGYESKKSKQDTQARAE